MIRLVNPLRQRICPRCGEEFYPGECAIVSTVDGSEIEPERKGMLSRAFVQPILGRKYARKLATRQCPNSACKYNLPYNIEYADSYTIAIVGDSSSGKSHYIASCIDQLKQYPTLQVIGCTNLTGHGDTDLKYRTLYYDYLYKQRIGIPPNQRGQINEPLIYELTFRSKSFLRPVRTINLLFYDSSGEDMIDQTALVQYSQFILNASAIIFLADPLAMPRIVDVLPTYLRPKAVRQDSPAEVMNRILRTFRMGKGIRPGVRLKTPMAITLSKSDLLQFVLKGGPTPLFMSKTAYASQLDGREFTIIDQQVRYFLQSSGDQVLVHSSQDFENVSFFAISATGWSMDPKDNKYPAIEPTRCLDPILWVLAQLKIIVPD